MTTGIRKPGDFCWINVLSPNPAGARAFFGALLDWTFPEMPPFGHLIRVGEHDIGGLFDSEGPGAPPGTTATIGVMIKVDDLDAACAKVAALGGTHQPPMQIANNMKMAVCQDPNGGKFDLWQSLSQHGTAVDSYAHGATGWFEAHQTNTETGAAFYQSLFGWKGTPMAFEWGTYTTFKLADTDVAGMMPAMGGMPSQWAVYFTVRDVEHTAAQATVLGGKVFLPVSPIPNVGRFCGIASPFGHMFFVIQYSR